VLRGEKTRFQLFGDTVNTASPRIVSRGIPNCIRISTETANLLINAGKAHWVKLQDAKESKAPQIHLWGRLLSNHTVHLRTQFIRVLLCSLQQDTGAKITIYHLSTSLFTLRHLHRHHHRLLQIHNRLPLPSLLPRPRKQKHPPLRLRHPCGPSSWCFGHRESQNFLVPR
jgi:hypothetical protein